ncbi:MAG: DUF6338 family protein [Actinomycetota bacterium]|nr:DUF6338 family protein [Actinomycetota bacterium]
MPQSLQGIFVVAIAMLPGALYTWGFERIVGSWGAGLSDRLLRFIGVSAGFHVLWAPADLWIWREIIRSGRLEAGDVPLSLWLSAVIYVGAPFAAGTIVGRATRRRRPWATWFTGPSPAPRAWDQLFSPGPDGWIRLRLRSGAWIGGVYSRHPSGGLGSYAAGYPDPQDLLLGDAAEVDPDSGEFLVDADGSTRMIGSAILIRWDQVEYLVFTDT